MFIFLSKNLDLLASPLTWVLLLILLALFLGRRPRALAAVLIGAFALLWAFSTGKAANLFLRLAEAPAVRTERPGVTYDAVVVLSGMVDERAARASGGFEVTAEVSRLLAGFELLRDGRARQVLLSGGPLRREPGVRVEPEVLADALRRWGIDGSRIVLEARSRNTHESAVEVARIVKERGWKSLLLVTSAYHMPRALGCFEKAGLSPDALPVDWRGSPEPAGLVPRASALAEATHALRELVGRLVYRVVGFS